MGEKPPVFWKTVVAGASAGVAEICLMYPTDVLKTRMQLSKARLGMFETFQSVVKEQGPLGLYRGIFTPIMAEAPKRAWKFGANNQFKELIISVSPEGKLTVSGAAAAGALAGMSEALINCPFETIKVRMQAKENLARFKNTAECLTATLKEEGVLALYNGLGPQMWRNAFWNGIYFGCIGVANIKYPLPDSASKEKKMAYKFITGSVGSGLGTLFNTPFDVVKSRMQQQMGPGPDGKLKYRNTIQSLGVIAQEEGVPALYKGLSARLARLIPGGGIMVVAFDFVMNLLKDYE